VLVRSFLLLLVAGLAAAGAHDADWPFNGGPDNIRYSPLAQINRGNVSRLRVAWAYDSHDAFKGSEMQSNPIVVDGVLYATTPTLKVVAVDAASGKEIWTFDPSGGARPGVRFRHRGVTVHKDRVLVSYRNFLYALDKKTGRPIESFGVAGRIDLREGLGMPPERASVSASTPGSIFEDLIIMGSTVPETLPGTPGHIRAYDVNTGQLRWIFHTIPQPGEPAYDTWPPEAYKVIGGPTPGPESPSTRRTASCSRRRGRPRSIFTVSTARGTISTQIPSLRSTRERGNVSGTSRASATISGTGTSPRRRAWSL
jgi:quinoprotein glucose dehydrogenase